MSDPGHASLAAQLSDELAELVARVAPSVVALTGEGEDFKSLEVDGKRYTGLAVSRDKNTADDGLQVNDVIVRLAGEDTDEPSDLYRILTRRLIDVPTNAQVLREGKLVNLTIRPTRLTDA